MKFANHDFDVHAEIVFLAQNLDHASARILRGRRPIGDLDVHYHAIQILPIGVLGGLFADDTMLRGLSFLGFPRVSCG